MMKLDDRFSDLIASLSASEIRDILKLTEGRKVISLAGGLPDPLTMPVEEIREITREVLDKEWKSALQYSASLGITQFREELAKFSRLRGINAEVNNIIATTGSQEALFVLSYTLINENDDVIVEAPTYLAALNVFRLRKPRFHGVKLQLDGMDINELEDKVKKIRSEGRKVKFLYTVPTAQNPGGVTMSLEKRKALMEIASRYDFLVIEDDAYGHLVFEGDNPPSLKSMDKEGRVIYTSTMSKILSPGLRLGWVVAENEIINKMELYKQNISLHTPSLNQYIAAEALKRGVVVRQIPKIRQIYKEKRDVMLKAIQDYFPKDVVYSRPVGGMFFFAWLNERVNTKLMLQEALKRGVAYVPGEGFYHDLSGKNTMRINFSYPSKEEIEEGIKILGQLIKDFNRN